MRFNTCALLFGLIQTIDSASANLRSPIRAHEQFLIQSVRDSPVQYFEDYIKDNKVGLCREASAFQNFTPKTNGDSGSGGIESNSYYRDTLSGQARRAASDTRKFVQSMEYLTRRDDVRRALDMRETWEKSILAEMNDLIAVLGTRSLASTGHSTKGGEIKGLPTSDGNEAQLMPTTNGHFKKSRADEELDKILTNPAPWGGKGPEKDNTVVDAKWDARKGHYDASATALSEIARKLKEMMDASNTDVWGKHFEFVASDSGFSLKWPMDAKQLVSTITSYAIATLDTPSADDRLKNLLRIDAPPKLEEGEVASNSVDYLEYTAATKTGSAELVANAGNQDQYLDESALADGQALVDAVAAGDLSTFTKINDKNSPSQVMARLTGALNVLQIRKLGLADARLSLGNLVSVVQDHMIIVREALRVSLTSIARDLKKNEAQIMKMYAGVSTLENVDLGLTDGKEAEKFSDLLATLEESYEGRAEKSLAPRVNYVANSIRAIHRHLLAFVGAHGKVTESITIDDAAPKFYAEDIKTEILTVIDTGMFDISKATETNAALAKSERNARVTATCLLYGRVDGLEVYKKYPDAPATEACIASSKYGEEVLVKLGEKYKVKNMGGNANIDKYYGVLGLNRDATLADVKKVHKALALKYHPDKNRGNEAVMTPKFQKVDEAYKAILAELEPKNSTDAERPDNEVHVDSETDGSRL